MLATGYFGIPGSSRGSFTVHVVRDDGRPLCRYRPRKEMRLQWCAHGIQWDYLECSGCKEKAKPLLKIMRERER